MKGKSKKAFPEKDYPTSYRFDFKTRKIIEALSEKLSMPNVQILKLAVRFYAKSEGLK